MEVARFENFCLGCTVFLSVLYLYNAANHKNADSAGYLINQSSIIYRIRKFLGRTVLPRIFFVEISM
jgi:hypothetical protein